MTPRPLKPKKKPGDEVADLTAAQCISPASATIVSPDVLLRAEQVKKEQKDLIANREKNIELSSKPYLDPPRPPILTPTPDPTSANPSLPRSAMVTPPSSTTQGSPTGIATPKQSLTSESTAGVSSPSFGTRRSGKPAPLDIGALRRERQYSGPYSANPILNRKRNYKDTLIGHIDNDEEEENSVGGETSTRGDSRKHSEESQSDPSSTRKSSDSEPVSSNKEELPRRIDQPPQIPPIHSAPFVSAALPHFRDPFPVTPLRTADRSIFPDFRSAPDHDKRKLLAHHTNTLSTLIPGMDDHRSNVSASPFPPQYPPSSSTDRTRKRAKFMDLCGQLWDLLEQN